MQSLCYRCWLIYIIIFLHLLFPLFYNIHFLAFQLQKAVLTFEGKDAKLYSIWLCFINEEKLGKAISVSEFLTDHSSSSYFIEFPMDNIFTYVAGKIKIWLKLLDDQTGMIDYTNYVTKHICVHPNEELEGEITEQERSILESLMIKLDATSIQLGEVTAKVENIISGEEQIIQPMFISTIYDGIEE